MKDLAFLRMKRRPQLGYSRLGSARLVPAVDLLLVAALVTDLVTPFFVSAGILPGATSWISHAFLLAAVVLAYTRMMIFDHLPGAVWAILGISLIGVTVALFRDQGFAATLWGWWLLFRFPLVGLYAYLHPGLPDRFSQWLLSFCLIVVGVEVLFQIGQYLSGETPGDDLSGTFGSHGVGHLMFLTVFTVSLAFGQWLAHSRWKPLVLALVLGTVSGVLAENRMFPVAVLLLAAFAGLLLLARGMQLRRLVALLVVLGVGLVVFIRGYNAFVPGAQVVSFEERFLDEDYVNSYLGKVRRSEVGGGVQQSYRMGRNLALEYAWSTIIGDPVTLLFGFGLGARGDSISLGISGSALKQDKFVRGSNLVIMMQEMGLFGLVVIMGFVVWVTVALIRDIRRYPHAPAVGLRYALLLFSVFWPLWLWYKKPLESRVTMLIYWVALGYVFRVSREYERLNRPPAWTTQPSPGEGKASSDL
ncbi:hypothetical protein ACFLYD_01040 [Chloroflexota bacterium]